MNREEILKDLTMLSTNFVRIKAYEILISKLRDSNNEIMCKHGLSSFDASHINDVYNNIHETSFSLKDFKERMDIFLKENFYRNDPETK